MTKTPEELLRIQKRRERRAAEAAEAAATPMEEDEAAAPPKAKKRKAEQAEGGASKKPQAKEKKAGKAQLELPQLALLSPEQQGVALWQNYQSECGGSYLEQEAFGEEHFVAAAAGATRLQAQLQAAAGVSWRDLLARPPRDAPCGAPACLLLTGSALRACELIKLLPDLHRACPVAKLFGKHLKPAEQAEALASAQLCLGAGTPARVDKLVGMGALSLSRLQLLVLDTSRDVKKRNLLDIPETRRDFWTLWRHHLSAPISAGTLRVLLIDGDA